VIIINKGQLIADDTLQNLQQRQAGNGYIQVTFGEPVEAAALEQLPEVTRVVGSEGNTWQLFTGNVEAVRKNLLQFALINNRNILSLQSNSQSLEAIFRQLTN